MVNSWKRRRSELWKGRKESTETGKHKVDVEEGACVEVSGDRMRMLYMLGRRTVR